MCEKFLGSLQNGLFGDHNTTTHSSICGDSTKNGPTVDCQKGSSLCARSFWVHTNINYHATFAATAPRPQPPQSSNFRKKWREYTERMLLSKKKNASGQIERKEGNSVETSKMRQMGGKTPYSRRKRALNCGPRKIGPKKRGPSWSKVAKQKWGRDIYAKFRRQKANYFPVANPVWDTHTHICTHAKEKKMTKSWRRALIHFYPTLASFSKLTSGTSP